MSVDQVTNKSKQGRSPESLLRLLAILTLVSVLLVVSLTSYGIYRVYAEHILRSAEDDAIRISEVVLAQEGNLLLSGGASGISLPADDMTTFDTRIRTFLRPFNIVKIKVFDLEGKIVYSTDRNIIGKLVQGNPRLARALSGEVDSKQETKEEVIDLAEEQHLDVDVVETYLPVRDSQRRIAGSFELYVDVTHYRHEIANGVGTSVAILSLILLAVFAVSFFVVRMGTNQLKVAQEELRRMATTDALTGIYNRGMVLSRAQEELSRILRRNEKSQENSLGVIMIDLDRFKSVNDTYGHQAGDEVLRQMALRVRSCMREYDVFGRYGGEEFLLIVPDAGQSGAMSLAERVRQVLRAEPFVIGDLSLPVTASLGVTCTNDPQEGFDAALKRADEALYLAKDSGRDKVVWMGQAGSEGYVEDEQEGMVKKTVSS